MVTHSQNLRSEDRLSLEAANSSLQLIKNDGGGYPPQAVVAGTLSSLISLDQPVLAMRVLVPAWEDGAVHLNSAVWLLGKVLESDDASGQSYAIASLEEIVDQYIEDPSLVTKMEWPDAFDESWRRLKSANHEIQLLMMIGKLFLAQRPDVNGDFLAFAVKTCFVAASFRFRATTKTAAAMLLRSFLRLYEGQSFHMEVQGELIHTSTIRGRAKGPINARSALEVEKLVAEIDRRVDDILSWRKGDDPEQLGLF